MGRSKRETPLNINKIESFRKIYQLFSLSTPLEKTANLQARRQVKKPFPLS